MVLLIIYYIGGSCVYLSILYRRGAACQGTEGVDSHGQSGARKTGMDERSSCTQEKQHQKGTNQETRWCG